MSTSQIKRIRADQPSLSDTEVDDTGKLGSQSLKTIAPYDVTAYN
ncbi:hypothetical protein ACUYOF_20730 [Photobacterium ganghwense]